MCSQLSTTKKTKIKINSQKAYEINAPKLFVCMINPQPLPPSIECFGSAAVERDTVF
jgi:hypothetical protein